MFYFPAGCLVFAIFILALPVLFFLGYFQIITIGFEKLGFSQELTLLLFLAILLGSLINIPIGRKKVFYSPSGFLGFWRSAKPKIQGVAVNLGGAIIPTMLSFYFFYLTWLSGFSLKPIFLATFLMILISKFFARVVPGVGVSIPVLLPPIFSAIFALTLAPDFAAPCAFISGTIGVLVGGDILNLKKAISQGGFLSIGGAGVFDGIFLVGIVSALLIF